METLRPGIDLISRIGDASGPVARVWRLPFWSVGRRHHATMIPDERLWGRMPLLTGPTLRGE
jgi:hypothetical protein